jgi:23S rRNA pseudouridine1911/1915/1917 synthase
MAAENPKGEKVVVAANEAGERLDRVLAARTALSRSRLKALILDGAVAIGPRTVRDPGYRVNAGDVITVDVPPPEPAEPAAERIPLNVVYEDADIIVIDKPAGLVVHPAAGHASGTRSLLTAGRVCPASAASSGPASCTGSTRTPPA